MTVMATYEHGVCLSKTPPRGHPSGDWNQIREEDGTGLSKVQYGGPGDRDDRERCRFGIRWASGSSKSGCAFLQLWARWGQEPHARRREPRQAGTEDAGIHVHVMLLRFAAGVPWSPSEGDH